MGKQVKELAPEALEIRPCRNTRAAGGGPQSLEQQERKHIEWVLEQTGGNRTAQWPAARKPLAASVRITTSAMDMII
jgi:hypothetical protein